MNTLNLQQAAELLQIHPVTLQVKAKSGEIPGAKIGKCWVFVDIDLIDPIRSHYARQTLQGEQEKSLCHSINEKTRLFGGSRSPLTDELYKKALERPTKAKPRNFMTVSRPNFGNKLS
jgi:Helix-turn-helix domain